MRFFDEAKISVAAGKGGDGCVSFRREKYVPRGGPDGGDGGDGGRVVIKVNPQNKTLIDYHYKRHYQAQNGANGQGSCKKGKNGINVILYVPKGTLIKNENNEILGDLITDKDEFMAARGGKGGKGNARFALPWRQAPDFAEKGKDGESGVIFLELKLMADVGIVGFPNVGKSSLIRKISSSKAQVADYPFTTLVPNLGVVVREQSSFIVADCPGLIEGASQGIGLGHKFLKHVERTGILVHMLDVTRDDPINDFTVLNTELKNYDAKVAAKPQIVCLNKIDTIRDKKNINTLKAYFTKKGYPFFPVSAITGEGVEQLVQNLFNKFVIV